MSSTANDILTKEFYRTLEEIEKYKLVELEKDISFSYRDYDISFKKGQYVHRAPKKLLTKFVVLYDMFCKLEYKEEVEKQKAESKEENNILEKITDMFGGEIIDSDLP